MKRAILLLFVFSLTGVAAQQDAPARLDRPGDWGIGKKVSKFPYTTLKGTRGDLSDLFPAVLAFTAVDCPLSKLYRPKIDRLAERYGKKGIRFLYIYCDFDD